MLDRGCIEEVAVIADRFEKLAKSKKKWVQKAIKRPGRVRDYFGISEDKPLPMGRLKNKYKELAAKKDKTKEEKSLMSAIGMAIGLKGGDIPGGEKKKMFPKKKKKASDED